MKPMLNVLSSFIRVEETDGDEHFAGTLNLAALRKMKVKEIEVVLMPVKSVPKTLVGLINGGGGGKAEFFLFGSAARETDE